MADRIFSFKKIEKNTKFAKRGEKLLFLYKIIIIRNNNQQRRSKMPGTRFLNKME